MKKFSIRRVFFQIFSYYFMVYAYFTYVANANTMTDDVTKLVMYRVLNTD